MYQFYVYIKIYIKLFSTKLYIVNDESLTYLIFFLYNYFIKKFINFEKFDLLKKLIYLKNLYICMI